MTRKSRKFPIGLQQKKNKFFKYNRKNSETDQKNLIKVVCITIIMIFLLTINIHKITKLNGNNKQ